MTSAKELAARPPRLSLIMGSAGVRIWTADDSLRRRYPDDVVHEYVPAAERAVIGDGDTPGPGWVEAMLLRNGVRLPLKTVGDGDIEDASGEPVLQVDPNCERPDDQVAEIAAVVVAAINTCGGHATRQVAAT